jgi:hypothetical protein
VKPRRCSHFFGFADQVETAGDADQVFLGHGAVGDGQRFFQRVGDLGHFAVELDVSGGQFVGSALRTLSTRVKITLSAPLVMRSSMPATSLSAQQPKITTIAVVGNVLADGRIMASRLAALWAPSAMTRGVWLSIPSGREA